MTKGFISQVERDLTSPSIATLVDILESLGTNLQEFFNETLDEKVVFTMDDVFESENEDHNYVLKWIIPNAQKNIMEPILMEIGSYGKTKEDFPHEGEEFGYVISGSVLLNIGEDSYKVKKGESFYFRANSNHYLVNTGKTIAKIVWVSTPPSF